MSVIIKLNGVEIPESLVVVDSANQTVTLETFETSEMELDTRGLHVEVNIFGKLPW